MNRIAFRKIDQPASVTGRHLDRYAILRDGTEVGEIRTTLKPVRGAQMYATSYVKQFTVRFAGTRRSDTFHTLADAKASAKTTGESA